MCTARMASFLRAHEARREAVWLGRRHIRFRRRSHKERAMTIAAGFLCSDGAVLAADSQWTGAAISVTRPSCGAFRMGQAIWPWLVLVMLCRSEAHAIR
jgi:hypothetical protein